MNFLKKHPLLQYLFIYWITGFLLTIGFTLGTLFYNLKIYNLVFASKTPAIPILLLFMGFLISITNICMGIGIFMLRDKKDENTLSSKK